MNRDLSDIIEEVKRTIGSGDRLGLLTALTELNELGYFHRGLFCSVLQSAFGLQDTSSSDQYLSLFTTLVSPQSFPSVEDNQHLLNLLFVEYCQTLGRSEASADDLFRPFCLKWIEINHDAAMAAIHWLESNAYQAYLKGDNGAGHRTLRMRALFSIPVQSEFRSESVTYVIPVLDLSPSTPGNNFLTLLDDLSHVDGDVVVIFNNQTLGFEYRNHPRITRCAIMSCNVGVSRAWSVGISLTETEYAIIMNADARIFPGCAEALIRPFTDDQSISMTGPVGFNAKGEVSYTNSNDAIVVDCIAGFLFCVRTKEYQQGRFYFDPMLTPAFSEEEDLSHQYAARGAKMLMVPTRHYKHAGSGSHRHRGTIEYMNRSIQKATLLARNLDYVRHKWGVESTHHSLGG